MAEQRSHKAWVVGSTPAGPTAAIAECSNHKQSRPLGRSFLSLVMLDRLHAWLKRSSTWPVFAILLFQFLLANQGFQWRREILGYEVRVLDVRFGYRPQEAVDLLNTLGPNGRSLYALTEITLDLVFPFFYSG